MFFVGVLEIRELSLKDFFLKLAPGLVYIKNIQIFYSSTIELRFRWVSIHLGERAQGQSKSESDSRITLGRSSVGASEIVRLTADETVSRVVMNEPILIASHIHNVIDPPMGHSTCAM